MGLELNTTMNEPRDCPPVSAIISAVCYTCGVTFEDVTSSFRNPRIVSARELIVYLSRKWTVASFPEIAVAMWRDTHSTAVTAMRRFEARLKEPGNMPGFDMTPAALIAQVEASLGAKYRLPPGCSGLRAG